MAAPRLKKGLIQFVWNLAASVFVGISVYGLIIYWGGETNQKVPMWESLLLGGVAVICIVVMVSVGGLQDRIAARDSKD